jgi:hypothetical protein
MSAGLSSTSFSLTLDPELELTVNQLIGLIFWHKPEKTRALNLISATL